MNPTFTYAVEYSLTATCATPLRVGSDGDVEDVLRRSEGTPMVQGTSLAGALRDWMHTFAPQHEDGLMGSQQEQGRLFISDALFDTNANMVSRPRLRIDNVRGVGADHAKFDMAHMETGSIFTFALTWMGNKDQIAELQAVENALSALHRGEITVGSQKTNGFGKVRLSGTKATYDMGQEKQRLQWIDHSGKGDVLTFEKAPQSKLVKFTLTGTFPSVLVQGASAKHTGESSCTYHVEENGKPVIPGSSVKGALRNRVTMIAKYLGLPEDAAAQLFGSEEAGAGRVLFEDVILKGQSKEITRIRINGFSGGVMRGGLFTEAPVCSPATMTVYAPNEEVACGLVLFALRDLALGLYHLGSGSAIGRGRFQVQTLQVKCPDGKMGQLSAKGDGTLNVQDEHGIFANWLAQLV